MPIYKQPFISRRRWCEASKKVTYNTESKFVSMRVKCKREAALAKLKTFVHLLCTVQAGEVGPESGQLCAENAESLPLVGRRFGGLVKL